MTTLPVSGYFENAARTHQEMKDAFEDQRDFITERFGGAAASELTIAAGSVTPTIGLHSIDTQADAASDELTNIVTTNLDAGSPLLIYAEDDARTIVLKHESGGAGQLHLIDDADYSLDDVEKFIIFVRIGADWYEVFRGYHAASTSEQGVVELATNAETIAMTDTTRPITPDGLGDLLQYSEIYVDAAAMAPLTTNGAKPGKFEYTTNDWDVDYYAFDDATEEYVTFKLPLPPTWDRGTIKAKFYWSSATGSTSGDTVEWQIAGQAISDSDPIDVALGDAGEVISDTLLANNGTDMQITPATPAITFGGTPALGDYIFIKVSRNVAGTDNMIEDAWLFGVLLQIKHDKAVAAW